ATSFFLPNPVLSHDWMPRRAPAKPRPRLEPAACGSRGFDNGTLLLQVPFPTNNTSTNTVRNERASSPLLGGKNTSLLCWPSARSYMYPVCVLSQNGSSANNSARGFGARIGAQNKPLPRAGFGSETSGAKD